ncbi:hypothetical protein LSH36_330g09002 [Paralvinella palmiformis]|uniref:Uncharacterized protein n=1 Tax=Paralvinella palmiformis TaxID=53620 RepID=A0AAD9N0M6_9ANNE|nr:hypothetical protein LSH36_330g09002 [Paralvinella palmiformis]
MVTLDRRTYTRPHVTNVKLTEIIVLKYIGRLEECRRSRKSTAGRFRITNGSTMRASLLRTLICFSAISLLVVVVPVNASLAEYMLNVPLFEVGTLWLNASRTLMANLLSSVRTPDFANPLTYVLLAVLAYFTRKTYQLLFVSLNRIRLLGELGYIPDGKMTMKDMVNKVRKSRQVGDCPPVYPNGWFAVIESQDLQVKQSKTVSMLGG